jgi:phage recombination protein Bet
MATETALATITVTEDQMALVKRTIAQGATDEELRLFMYDCQRNGVHPLDRMLHFTKRGGRYTPITSIDLMRTRAAETGECAGIDDAAFPPDDDGLPKWASVTVYRLTGGARFPYTATARWLEYYPGDAQGMMWRKMPHTMLGKCAEALALRKAFPKQLQGLYAREEMDQANGGGATSAPDERRAVHAPGVSHVSPGPTTDEAATLFPKPEDEERSTLVAEATRLAKGLKLTAVDKAAMKQEHLGGAELDSADLSALATMVKALQDMEAKVNERKAAK